MGVAPSWGAVSPDGQDIDIVDCGGEGCPQAAVADGRDVCNSDGRSDDWFDIYAQCTHYTCSRVDRRSNGGSSTCPGGGAPSRVEEEAVCSFLRSVGVGDNYLGNGILGELRSYVHGRFGGLWSALCSCSIHRVERNGSWVSVWCFFVLISCPFIATSLARLFGVHECSEWSLCFSSSTFFISICLGHDWVFMCPKKLVVFSSGSTIPLCSCGGCDLVQRYRSQGHVSASGQGTWSPSFLPRISCGPCWRRG